MRKLQKTTKSAPTPQQSRRFVYTFKIGWFTAFNIKLEEVAINEVVLRVPLSPQSKRQKTQPKRNVSPKKFPVSSPKTIQKSKRRYSTIHDNKSSSGKQPTQRKRSAEQSSLSSPNYKSILKPKRRCLTVTDSNDSSTKQSPSKRPSKVSFESKPVNCESVKKPKHLSLPSKSPSNKETVKTPSKPSVNSTPPSSKFIKKPKSLTVNGSKDRSSKQKTPVSASEQLSPKTTKNEVKGALKSGQNTVAAHTVKKDDNFASKLRQKLKHLVGITSFSGSQTKLTVDFTKLSNLVLHMKLPSEDWRVTVLMNRDLSLVFEFTNKSSSKYVRFAETKPYCNIVVCGKSVILLGCPSTVDSLKDIEILLEIVDKLNLTDCMIVTSS